MNHQCSTRKRLKSGLLCNRFIDHSFNRASPINVALCNSFHRHWHTLNQPAAQSVRSWDWQQVWAVWVPHQCHKAVILCHLLHNTCHICTDEWVLKLSVNISTYWQRTIRLHAVIRRWRPIAMPYFTLILFPYVVWQLKWSFYVHKGKSMAAFISLSVADVRWVGEMTVLTVSAYLLVLTQWEQGHCSKHLPYHHIYICGANPQPRANFFLFFVLLCLWVSGGLFVPCAGTMQAVGSRTILCSESSEETARSFTSYYARKLPVTSFSKQVWLYTSPLDEREKKHLEFTYLCQVK